MSTSRGKPSFSELMAKHGYDPDGEHPELKPKRMPQYVGRGVWVFDGQAPPEDLDDDSGYGPDEPDDLSWMDGR